MSTNGSMDEGKTPMGQKELHRWHLMNMADVGKITFKEAAEKIGVSCWLGKRIRVVSGEGRQKSVRTEDLFVAI